MDLSLKKDVMVVNKRRRKGKGWWGLGLTEEQCLCIVTLWLMDQNNILTSSVVYWSLTHTRIYVTVFRSWNDHFIFSFLYGVVVRTILQSYCTSNSHVLMRPEIWSYFVWILTRPIPFWFLTGRQTGRYGFDHTTMRITKKSRQSQLSSSIRNSHWLTDKIPECPPNPLLTKFLYHKKKGWISQRISLSAQNTKRVKVIL